ncbi:glycoside hydrolase [bacterium M21]|nr:glycoside hydrolase [bacterium M21]
MDFGIIGNCKSAALIDKQASITWCCLPDFDSPSVFAGILDDTKGGLFGFEVDDSYTIKQRYVPNTNIMVTRFTGEYGAFDVFDFMPRSKHGDSQYHCPPEVIRYIRRIHGVPEFKILYRPRLGYGRHETFSTSEGDYIKSCVKEGPYESVYLYSDISHDRILKEKTIVLRKDCYLLLSYHQKILQTSLERIVLEYERTKVYWLEWVARTTAFTSYMTHVKRSALVLKLLSYQDSGAILAAVTTSLPETIGEERNWDYRFCWIRDASMILSVLTRLGHYNVARNFLDYVLSVVPFKDDKMQIMYGIRGDKDLTEKILDWLDGYKGSKPVHIGNAAYIQQQNDIYGGLLDAILKYIEVFPNDINTVERLWTITRSLVRAVSQSWTEPDMGIWEFRGDPRHFVFSKVLCWVALDRGIKIAAALNTKAEVKSWVTERTRIKKDIMKNGWNEELGAFTQTYNGNSLDASGLLMAAYGFIGPKDPKFVSTVKKTKEELCHKGLMYRYKSEDDFGLPKSSFTVCSFWMVKALWQIGEHEQAKEMFENLLDCSNHLQLFSEDLDFETREMLGNFPQGYSHLALIDCALTLCHSEMEKESELIEYIEHLDTREK